MSAAGRTGERIASAEQPRVRNLESGTENEEYKDLDIKMLKSEDPITIYKGDNQQVQSPVKVKDLSLIESSEPFYSVAITPNARHPITTSAPTNIEEV